jgi:hypothetical protein
MYIFIDTLREPIQYFGLIQEYGFSGGFAGRNVRSANAKRASVMAEAPRDEAGAESPFDFVLRRGL